MPNTSHGLPYPASTDTPDVPRDVQALAAAVDTKLLTKVVVGKQGVTTSDGSGNISVSFSAELTSITAVVVTNGDLAAFGGYLGASVSGTTVTIGCRNPGGSAASGISVRWNVFAYGAPV